MTTAIDPPINPDDIAISTARSLLEELDPKLAEQKTRAARFASYYEGDHPLPDIIGSEDKRITYKTRYLQLMKESRTNWMELVVNAPLERLHVARVRGVGDTATVDAFTTLWQTNRMQRRSRAAIKEALITGQAYLSVWWRGDVRADARIAVEAGDQVIVKHSAEDPERRLAALKRWRDGDVDHANVYTNGLVVKFTRPKDSDDEWTATAHETGIPDVPIVPLYNRQGLRPAGRSEMDGYTDIQDRINRTLFGRMITQHFQAFAQRWATGLGLEQDSNGNFVVPFDSGVDSLWVNEDPAGKFGEFKPSDLTGYIKAVEADVQHLAAITRTPPHYLLGQSGAFPSGESLKSTETGLVAKTKDRAEVFGDAIAEAISLAHHLVNPDAKPVLGVTDWVDPESRSEAELLDAATKRVAIGVPHAQAWSDIGYTDDQIEGFDQLRDKYTPPTPEPTGI